MKKGGICGNRGQRTYKCSARLKLAHRTFQINKQFSQSIESGVLSLLRCSHVCHVERSVKRGEIALVKRQTQHVHLPFPPLSYVYLSPIFELDYTRKSVNEKNICTYRLSTMYKDNYKYKQMWESNTFLGICFSQPKTTSTMSHSPTTRIFNVKQGKFRRGESASFLKKKVCTLLYSALQYACSYLFCVCIESLMC